MKTIESSYRNFIQKYGLTDRMIFLILIVIVLIDRSILLVNYNFKYTGNDDVVVWQGALNYSAGFFHEPYFFGQNYNFMLESLLAVPFIYLGLPYYIALPLVTSILALFPFIFMGMVLFKNKRTAEAFMFISLPLFLPVEFGILTSISRGFVTGFFFLSFMVYPMLKPQRISSIILFAFSCGLGYVFNPNSLIFSIPIGIYVFSNNYRKIPFYLIVVGVLAACYLIEFYAKQFYVHHPEYMVHEMWKLEFSPELFLQSFSDLDKFFSGLTPLLWFMPWIGLPLLLYMTIIIFLKDKVKGVSLFTGVIFIIFMFSINKVHDNIGSVFLSSSRMFLPFPLLLALSVFWWIETKKATFSMYRLKNFLVIVLIVFVLKISFYQPVLKTLTVKTDYGPVAIMKIEDLKSRCNQIKMIADKYNVELIVYAPDWQILVTQSEFLNYGCGVLINDFKRTVMTKYERRYWRYKEELTSVRKNILLYGNIYLSEEEKLTLGCKITKIEENVFIISGNAKTLKDLMTDLKINLSRN